MKRTRVSQPDDDVQLSEGSKKRRRDQDQLDDSTETPVNERPLGQCSPTEKASPYSVVSLKDEVFGKFANARIYVNSDEVIPERVWFMPSKGAEDETYPASGKHCEVLQLRSDGKPSIGQYRPKWIERRNGEGMLKMFSMFEDVGKFLRWNGTTKSWSPVPFRRTVQSDSSSGVSSSLAEKLEDLFDIQYFVLALKQSMVNSEGRRAIYMLLQCACTIIFGHGFTRKNKAGIYCLGWSRCEAFPVEVVNSACQVTRRSSDHDCDLSSFEMDNNITDKSDIIVASGHEPNWPHCLLVGKIKSKALNQKYMSQLIREMVAPLMHQSELFGLIINDREASIVHLQHQFQEKLITLKTCSYSFVSHSEQRFSCSEMNRFFVDLVAVLDYAKNETKEIHHGF